MPSPYTPEQEAAIVQAHGLDPAQWQITPDGASITSRVQAPVTPTVSAQPQPLPQGILPSQPQDPSALATGVHEAIHSAPSAVGGGIGAGTGLAIGAALAPETGGLSFLIPAVTMLAGGYLGGKAVSSVQDVAEKNLAPDYLKQLSEMEQEHPTAAKIGQLATLPLSGLNPNPLNAVKAVGALGKVALAEGGATPEELQNLMNVTAGAGIGGIQSALSGGSAKDITENALVGATFNSPNTIGKWMGFHPLETRTIVQPDKYAQMLSAPTTGEQIVRANPDDEQNGRTYLPDVSSTSTGLPVSAGSISKARIPYLENTEILPAEVTSMEAEGGLIPKETETVTPAQQKELDFYAGRAERNKQNEEQQKQTIQQAFKVKAEEIAKALQGNTVGRPEQTVKPLTTELGKEIFPDYTGVTEHDNLENQEEIQNQNNKSTSGTSNISSTVGKTSSASSSSVNKMSDLEARNIEQRFSGEGKMKYQEGEEGVNTNELSKDAQTYQQLVDSIRQINKPGQGAEIQNAMLVLEQKYNGRDPRVVYNEKNQLDDSSSLFNIKRAKLQESQNSRLLTPSGRALVEQLGQLKEKYPNLDISRVSPELINTWAKEVSQLHGLTDEQLSGLENENGPVKGAALVGLNKTLVNPQLAEASTQPHENFHHIFASMPDDARNLLLSKTKGEWEQFNRERAGRGEPAFDQEEYLASEMGYRTVQRLLNTQFETPLKQWWNDFRSGVKTKFGFNPTAEDLYRNNVYKLVSGKSNIRPSVGGLSSIQNQEADVNDKRPQYIGEQQDLLGRFPPFKLYNLKEPIIDQNGKILHDVGSTVSENTLQKYGVKYQPESEGLTPYDRKLQRDRERNESLRGPQAEAAKQRRVEQAAEKDQLGLTGARSAGAAPHTYPRDEQGYQPPSSAPMRRVPVTMNEREEEVARKVVTKQLNRLFYKNLPPTLYKEWRAKGGALEELRDSALLELRKNGLDVPKPNEHNFESFGGDWAQYFEKNPSKLNETIASSAGRRAIEAFSNWTRRFKEQHGYTRSFDTAGIEGRGLHDVIGHVPTTEISSRAKETGEEGLKEKTDQKRVEKIKKEAEAGAAQSTVGKMRDILQDQLDDAKENEDTEMAEHFQSILDKIKHLPDDQVVKDVAKFVDSVAEMAPAKKTEGIGKSNLDELDKLKFQEGEEGLPSNLRAAIRLTNGETFSAPLDESHAGAFHKANEVYPYMKNMPLYRKIEQGYLTDEGKWIERHEAEKKWGFGDSQEAQNALAMRAQPGDEGVLKNKETTPSQKYNSQWSFAELDVARRKAGPEGQDVADALQQLPTVRDQYYGRYTKPVFDKSEGMSALDKKKVLTTLYNEDADGKSYRNLLTSDAQRILYDTIRQELVHKQTDQQKAGQKVTDFDAKGKRFQREAKVNPTYAPSILRADVIENILNRTSAGKRYEQQLLDYWKKQGASEQYAQERLKALKQMENAETKNETRFGANRLTEGMGLPPDLRVQDVDKMISRYFGRVSTDRAWHDVIEKNEAVNQKLKTDEDTQHVFGKIVDRIKGEPFDKDVGTIKALNRVVTSALLGPLTNVHIGMSTFFNPFQYVKGSELASVYARGMQHLGESAQHAIENGYKRKDLNTIRDIVDSQNTFIQKASAVSSLVGKVNGRDWTDKVAKTFAKALGEEIVPLRIQEARNGDEWSQRMMKQLDASWTPQKKYSPQEVSQLASVLGGMIHGSHDYRTLPELMNRETVVKPFLSLMSWSVAQTNQWLKHVWEPALKGDLQPLMMSTLGALVGGYVIQQMRQGISDKKSNIPSFSELLHSSKGLEGNIPLMAYNFMQMASYTGFMGLGSTIGKMGFDAAYKNIPQGATFPLDEAVTNVGKTVHDAVSAWLQTPDTDAFFQIFPRAMIDITKENYQLARIATSWAADYGISGETEKYKRDVNVGTQDLRRYRMAEGLPYEQQTESSNNPYLNMPAKEFKRTLDVGEAARDLPPILSLYMQRARGNPDVLKEEFQGLKQNSYQTMPSPETMPLQYARYYNFLRETYGPEIAAQRMKEYMIHSSINRVKAGLVPTI